MYLVDFNVIFWSVAFVEMWSGYLYSSGALAYASTCLSLLFLLPPCLPCSFLLSFPASLSFPLVGTLDKMCHLDTLHVPLAALLIVVNMLHISSQ